MLFVLVNVYCKWSNTICHYYCHHHYHYHDHYHCCYYYDYHCYYSLTYAGTQARTHSHTQSRCTLTWHKPIAALAEFGDVTSQLVQETFGFAVTVKEAKLRISTVRFVRIRQVCDLKNDKGKLSKKKWI